MDWIALAFYAAVCGLLAAFAPALGGRWGRFLIGAAVGVAAATALPLLRPYLGLGG